MIHPKPEISFGTELKLRSFERKRDSGEKKLSFIQKRRKPESFGCFGFSVVRKSEYRPSAAPEAVEAPTETGTTPEIVRDVGIGLGLGGSLACSEEEARKSWLRENERERAREREREDQLKREYVRERVRYGVCECEGERECK